MRRTSVIVVVAAVLIGYGALAGLGVLVIQQQSELRSIQARLGSPAAVITPSPAASPSPTQAFAFVTKVTDSLGHTWLPSTQGNPTVDVPLKSAVKFTTVAQDEIFDTFLPNPLNRPIEYAYTADTAPNTANTTPGETVLCGWGGASCSWTAPATTQTIRLHVYVRIKGAPHRFASGCGAANTMDPCDDSVDLDFQIVNSS